jgi:predicted acetyltransferase
MPDVPPTVRPAAAADLPEIALVDGRAFGVRYTQEEIDTLVRPLFDPDRFLLACDPDDGRILGVTGDYPFELTLPGGTSLPAAGVTWVSVATTHRRRGILRMLMHEQHRRLVERGYGVALLTASEAAIYGRFGYGPATVEHAVRIDRRRTGFRAGVPDPDGVRQVEVDEARRLAPDVHRRWCARTPGALSRSPAWWDNLLSDPEYRRRGASPLFHLLHADGYAAYRVAHGEVTTCLVVDLFAATDEAHLALWRVLLGLDLVDTVTSRACSPDDPLPFLLTDPRQVRTTDLRDGMWARVLDVPAALAGRRYAVEVDLVLEVHDAFLGLGGRFRLRGGPDGATCEATRAVPDVEADVAALGSLLLGGYRGHTLARAGLLRGPAPAPLRALDAAFAADASPRFGTDF